MSETLTDAGRAYARSAKDESLVARLALAADAGFEGDWPDAHVETAIRVCNLRGARGPEHPVSVLRATTARLMADGAEPVAEVRS